MERHDVIPPALKILMTLRLPSPLPAAAQAPRRRRQEGHHSCHQARSQLHADSSKQFIIPSRKGHKEDRMPLPDQEPSAYLATMDAQVGPILSTPNWHVKGDF